MGRLIASALNISDTDFLKGELRFTGGYGPVVNRGEISAHEVALIGKEVVNAGVIDCPAGYVVMAAGDRVFIGEPRSDVLVEIEAPALSNPDNLADSKPVITNEGSITLESGTIILSAAGDAYSQAISNVGKLSVSAGAGDGGNIRVTAGRFNNEGSITANAGDNAKAGDIEVVAGHDLTIERTSRIEAKGKDLDSDGGNVYLYSHGDVIAKESQTIDISGGTVSGDGGRAELSAAGGVSVAGTVLGHAQEGYENGEFLVDPLNASVGPSTFAADTIIWAEDNITVDGPVTIDTSGGDVTLSLLADHRSDTAFFR